MIGKLKRTLKERCPECGSSLQLREHQQKTVIKGVQASISEEYIACSNKRCNYTKAVEQKRRRRQDDFQ